MKSSIICTDLEKTSDAAVLTGYNLSKNLGIKPTLFFIDVVSSRLETLFHPIQITPTYDDDTAWKEAIENTVENQVSDQLKRLNLKKEDFNFESYEGTISQGIKHLAKKHSSVDYFFIGATHHGDLHRLFLNTFVEKTFFKLEKETFVIKKTAEKIDEVIYLIPFAPLNTADLNKVAEIATHNHAPVRLDCVVPVEFIGYNLEAFSEEPAPKEIEMEEVSTYHQSAEKELKKAVEILKGQNIEATYDLKMVLNKDPGASLKKSLDNQKNKLLVLKPQHYLFNHLSIGSTTLDIMRHVEDNILLLNSNE